MTCCDKHLANFIRADAVEVNDIITKLFNLENRINTEHLRLGTINCFNTGKTMETIKVLKLLESLYDDVSAITKKVIDRRDDYIAEVHDLTTDE